MPRANRHYIPGYVWHITHRCHKKEFLLKFARDRQRWMVWLFEAKKRYGLSILNFIVTSNHVHILVRDNGKQDAIARSIQLIAGRTGQEYNRRKKRKGAFWEDRYHATAVERGVHLIQCIAYIDMHMVRAGVVRHPSEWIFSGYSEIQNPRKRYSLIDYEGLMDLLNVDTIETLKEVRKGWVEESLKCEFAGRESKWTESVAVGGKAFAERTKKLLGLKAKGRHIIQGDGAYELREAPASYNSDFGH